jgi:hypothetical protein
MFNHNHPSGFFSLVSHYKYIMFFLHNPCMQLAFKDINVHMFPFQQPMIKGYIPFIFPMH